MQSSKGQHKISSKNFICSTWAFDFMKKGTAEQGTLERDLPGRLKTEVRTADSGNCRTRNSLLLIIFDVAVMYVVSTLFPSERPSGESIESNEEKNHYKSLNFTCFKYDYFLYSCVLYSTAIKKFMSLF